MRFLIIAIVTLAACSAATQNYSGDLRPIAGTCDPPSEALLTLRNTTIIFAPASGTTLLRGKIDGQVASADLKLIDPGKQPYHLSFQGVLNGRIITGTYVTPRCRYAATLRLTDD